MEKRLPTHALVYLEPDCLGAHQRVYAQNLISTSRSSSRSVSRDLFPELEKGEPQPVVLALTADDN